MKCTNCGKTFDEVKYSQICPKCGRYNRAESVYDVDQFYNYEEYGDKNDTVFVNGQQSYSTSSIARQEHEKIHRKNEQQSLKDAHADTYNRSEQDRKGFTKPKISAGFVCVIIIVFSILLTALLSYINRQKAISAVSELSYEEHRADIGSTLEIGNMNMIISGPAVTIDTSMVVGLPLGEKLIAVPVTVWSSESEEYIYQNIKIFINVGDTYKRCVEYELETILPTLGLGDVNIFDEYEYFYDPEEGIYLFFVDEDATSATMMFDLMEEKSGMQVLTDRYCIEVPIEEAANE